MQGSVGNRIGLCAALLFVAAAAEPQGTLETNRPTFKDDEISIAYEFVWGGPRAFGGFVPIRVDLDNPLKDDRGVVTVTSGTYKLHYPVELPSRSLRSFIVYLPASQSFNQSTIELNCRQVYLKATVDPPDVGSENSYNIGLISDSPSLITFLRTVKEQPSGAPGGDPYSVIEYRDFVCLPRKGPDRSIGYNGLDLLILAEGAERMTDPEVTAIQRYVLGGGTILMTGGAVSPILRDERWAAFVPGTEPVVLNVPGSSVVSSATGVPLRELTTVTKLTPVPGTTGLKENGIPMLWYRKCGLGMVVYWAFDPFQSPLRTYAGRQKLFTDTVAAISRAPMEYKTEIGVELSTFRDDYSGYPMPPGYPPMTNDQTEGSVFKVAMPPTGQVFLILACYFVVVVPLNFLVLNKLGKGQLAWVTSPIIGLAFAGVFFYVARDLYGASLSRATRALVVAHEGAPLAYVVGNQEIFFPVGGRYDLKLDGVEAVTTTSDFAGSYYGGPTEDTGFSDDLVDVGQVVAPNVGVSNLAFREIHFEQNLPWSHRLPLRLSLTRASGRLRASGAFTNQTPYDLESVTLWVGLGQIFLGDVRAGETKDINELMPATAIQERGFAQPPFSAGQVGLTADVKGFNAGTPIGTEQGRGAQLLYTYSSVAAEAAN
jgi:hypothetical protein